MRIMTLLWECVRASSVHRRFWGPGPLGEGRQASYPFAVFVFSDSCWVLWLSSGRAL